MIGRTNIAMSKIHTEDMVAFGYPGSSDRPTLHPVSPVGYNYATNLPASILGSQLIYNRLKSNQRNTLTTGSTFDFENLKNKYKYIMVVMYVQCNGTSGVSCTVKYQGQNILSQSQPSSDPYISAYTFFSFDTDVSTEFTVDIGSGSTSETFLVLPICFGVLR